MPNWLSQILAALVVAVVTALVTVRLSLQRFHSERWWERKADAYGRLIGALTDLMRYIDLLVDEELGEGFAEAYRAELLAKHREAFHELERATVMGRYLFSPSTVALLDAHRKRARMDPNYVSAEFFEKEKASYATLFDDLAASAKADLGVK